MSHAWAVTNMLSPLVAGAYTWGAFGPADATRAYLSDGRLDKQYLCTATATTINVVIDLGSAQAVSAIAILNTNVRDATVPKVLIEGADNSGMSTNLVTAKALTTLNIANYYEQTSKDHVLQFAAVTKRYWRITWSWTGTFALKIGELFACASTSLSRKYVWGSTDSAILKAVVNESLTGERRAAFFGGPIREKRMHWQDLTASESLELKALWNAALGPVRPVLWTESYEATATAAAATEQECILGRLGASTWAVDNPDFGLYQPGDVTIRSLGREVGA